MTAELILILRLVVLKHSLHSHDKPHCHDHEHHDHDVLCHGQGWPAH